MILVIAPFFAITLFFACSNNQSNENIWKFDWIYKLIYKLTRKKILAKHNDLITKLNHTSKTFFEWKQMILFIANFFANTPFFACLTPRVTTTPPHP